jgi:hypothetical protein
MVWGRFGGHCFYCGCPLPPLADWHVDHGVPLDQGGTDSVFNLYPACPPCNLGKHARTVEQFRTDLGAPHFFGEIHQVVEAAAKFGTTYDHDGQQLAVDWQSGFYLWMIAHGHEACHSVSCRCGPEGESLAHPDHSHIVDPRPVPPSATVPDVGHA